MEEFDINSKIKWVASWGYTKRHAVSSSDDTRLRKACCGHTIDDRQMMEMRIRHSASLPKVKDLPKCKSCLKGIERIRKSLLLEIRK